jgi:pimeloyl-ACP methyl ester carboxylesterase
LHGIIARQMMAIRLGESDLARFIQSLREMGIVNRARMLVDVATTQVERPVMDCTIVCAREDLVTAPRRVRALARAWGMPTVDVDACGHCVALENPQWLLELIEAGAPADQG